VTDQARPHPAQAPADTVELTAAPRRALFDSATAFGFLGVVALVAVAIALGGAAGAFINLPSILIVVGGTLAVTVMSFSAHDTRQTLSALVTTVVSRERDPEDAAYTMMELADYCRQHGVLRLQGTPLTRFAKEPFLHKGLSLVIDGLSEEEMTKILNQDVNVAIARNLRAATVLRKAAEVSPAMGLIGTLIGLVQMLGNLDDPSVIGPSMAVALLTTLYGALLANVVFNPLATKLEHNAGGEELICKLYSHGLISIARKEHPRKLEIVLNSALPPESKVRYFD
jgi:chemotaxis protein MotA